MNWTRFAVAMFTVSFTVVCVSGWKCYQQAVPDALHEVVRLFQILGVQDLSASQAASSTWGTVFGIFFIAGICSFWWMIRELALRDGRHGV